MAKASLVPDRGAISTQRWCATARAVGSPAEALSVDEALSVEMCRRAGACGARSAQSGLHEINRNGGQLFGIAALECYEPLQIRIDVHGHANSSDWGTLKQETRRHCLA